MNPFLVVRATILRHRGTYLLFILLGRGGDRHPGSRDHHPRGGFADRQRARRRQVRSHGGGARERDRRGAGGDLSAPRHRPVARPIHGGPGAGWAEPRAQISAPLGFGDNIRGSPIVGTVPAFVDYLSGGLSEGRVFALEGEAVAGAAAGVAMGEPFTPTMAATRFSKPARRGSNMRPPDPDGGRAHEADRKRPADNSVIAPIEFVWQVHGLPTGHAEGERPHRPAQRFDPACVPGVPAIVIKPTTINAAYGLRTALPHAAQHGVLFRRRR